jgi:hypothetical protein
MAASDKPRAPPRETATCVTAAGQLNPESTVRPRAVQRSRRYTPNPTTAHLPRGLRNTPLAVPVTHLGILLALTTPFLDDCAL